MYSNSSTVKHSQNRTERWAKHFQMSWAENQVQQVYFRISAVFIHRCRIAAIKMSFVSFKSKASFICMNTL